MNQKTFYDAMRRLPKKFVHEETKHTVFGSLIVANPNFPPIFYHEATRRWRMIQPPKAGAMRTPSLSFCGG